MTFFILDWLEVYTSNQSNTLIHKLSWDEEKNWTKTTPRGFSIGGGVEFADPPVAPDI